MTAPIPRPWHRMGRHLAPRPRKNTLRADEAEAKSTDQFGAWPHARLLRMDGRFKAAMAKAPRASDQRRTGSGHQEPAAAAAVSASLTGAQAPHAPDHRGRWKSHRTELGIGRKATGAK